MNIETAAEIVSYFEKGNVGAGDMVNDAAREFMAENGETDYRKALVGVHRNARAEIDEGFDEFGRRGRSYASHFKIGGSEAIARVQKHDKAMAHIYQLDPMRATETVGIQPAPAVADITVSNPDIPERFTSAEQEVFNVIAGLPKDADGYVTTRQVDAVLAASGARVDEAWGNRMDAKARAGIRILGLPNFSSDNYAAGFRWAASKFPALARMWAGGRPTAQGVREAFPQLLITD